MKDNHGTAVQPNLGFAVPVIALLVAAIFINYVDRGNLATAAPLIRDEMRLSNTQVGFLISGFFWIYVPGQLVAGWLIARIGAYRALALGLAIWSLATILCGFAVGFATFFALRILLGIGECLGFPATSQLIAQNVPLSRLGSINALVAAGQMLGPAVGTLLGGILIAHLGWRPLFLAFGTLSLLWLLPWWLMASRLPSERRPVKGSCGPRFTTLLKRRELWATGLGMFASNYPFYLVLSWLPLYLVKAQGYSVEGMAAISGGVYGLSAGASVLAGWGADRWMSRGVTSNTVRKTMIGCSTLITFGCMLACSFGGSRLSVAALLVSSVGNGLATFNIFAIGQTLAGPSAAGKWIGLQAGIGNLAGIIAPIVTGLSIDHTGGFSVAFLIAAGFTLVALFCWVVAIPKIEPLAWPMTNP